MAEFAFVRVEGTPYEMGYQHGTQCRETIRYLAGEGLFKEIARVGKADPVSIRNGAREYEPHIKSAAPHLIEEIRGIADGARIDYEEALILQCRSELVYRAKMNAECTSFAIARERSSGGEVIVGQNLDLASSFEEFGIILCLYPREGPAVMTWTLAGTLGQVGLNSGGLARCGNVLMCPGWRVGLPTTVLFRRILEQETVAGVEALIGSIYRAKSNAFVVGDRSGRVAAIETTVDEHRLLEPENGVVMHSNHYVHEDFLQQERFYDVPDSVVRLSRLRDLFGSHAAPLTVEDLKSFLRDHATEPNTICRHERTPGGVKTVVSVVSRPERGVMEVCRGNPCGGEYVEYRL
ncbi:MAG: C45 family autoproteolytic acyltransferase/hydrolase [Bacillota bacterium]